MYFCYWKLSFAAPFILLYLVVQGLGRYILAFMRQFDGRSATWVADNLMGSASGKFGACSGGTSIHEWALFHC